MILLPLYDRVVVRRLQEKKKSESGIILPEYAKEKPQQAEIIAIGNGRLLPDGTVTPMQVNVGQVVLLGRQAGQAIMMNDEELLVIREDEILAVVVEQ